MPAAPDMRVIAMLTGLMAIVVSGNHHPLLVWNASASAPRGLYRVIPAEHYQPGDLVLVDPQPWVGEFAARRGYLPAGVPLVKSIAAAASDTVCSDRLLVRVDGKPTAKRLLTDSKHRALPRWRGCHRLKPGEEFLLMRGVRDSFDGRYFGVTSIADNLGKLVPLWTY